MLHKHLERKKKTWVKLGARVISNIYSHWTPLCVTKWDRRYVLQGKENILSRLFLLSHWHDNGPRKAQFMFGFICQTILVSRYPPPPHVTIFAFLILSVGNLSSCLVTSKHGKCKNILSFLIHYQDNSDQCIEDKHGLLKPSSAADKLACLWGAGLCPLLMGTSCHASLGAQREEKVTSSFPPVNAWG